MTDIQPGAAAKDLARDEEDHDLLTYNESGIRLAEEIERVTGLLSDAPGEDRDALQHRLDALEVAKERNSRLAAINPGETGFLNYRPTHVEVTNA